MFNSLDNITSSWGELLGVSTFLDNDLTFKNSVLKVATHHLEEIDIKSEVNFEDKIFPIKCKEEHFQYHDWEFADEIDIVSSHSKDGFGISVSRDKININNLNETTNDMSDTEFCSELRHDPEVNEVRSLNEDDRFKKIYNNHDIVPVQPRSDYEEDIEIPIPRSSSDTIVTSGNQGVLITSIWKPRDSKQSTQTSEVNNDNGELVSLQAGSDIHFSDKSLSNIVLGTGKLKVVKKRGHPKKQNSSMPVKAFQVPGIPWKPIRSKKKSGRRTVKVNDKNVLTEARSILETGKLLGLSIEGPEEEVINNIVKIF